MAQISANKRSVQIERTKDKEMMDIQRQKHEEDEKQLNEYKRQQRELYKQALDQQVIIIV
jgi:hypothetical protein